MIRMMAVLLSCAFAFPVASQPAKRAGDLQTRIAETARQNALPVNFSNGQFSGQGWDFLLKEGKSSQFFMLGEEHGMAENPRLAAALFAALVPYGYSRLAIETSPQMAVVLENAARSPDSMAALRTLFADPASNAAFFGMLEEAEMLAAIARSLPGQTGTFWGVDYEVFADRFLISRLEGKEKDAAAEQALTALRTASSESWKKYGETGNPQFIFSFAADPALVVNLRNAWPEADAESLAILDTLEETFAINQLWMQKQGWASNARRAAFMRSNFLRHWRETASDHEKPKVFLKLGASHLVRGRNMTEVYDLGSLLPELAALEGSKTFQLLVLPGKGTRVAVFDPTKMRYTPGEPKDSYMEGLDAITGQAATDAFTLIDLRPLRPLLPRQREGVSQELMRVVHGFDAVLVMSGSTPSHNLLSTTADP